jgi:hypothetical protein
MPNRANEFTALFRQFEHAMKRTKYIKNADLAQADWSSLARDLGTDFFDRVQRENIAPHLIGEPPRKLMKQDLSWQPANPAPFRTAEELIVQGVCRVRNSLFHGEKFVGGSGSAQWKRDQVLVAEALAVLNEAKRFVPDVVAAFPK